MTGLNKIGLNQVQLNRLYLNAPFPVYRKMAGGGSSGDGFPQLPGDVTRWHFGGLTNEMMAAMDDPRIEDADGKGRFLSFKNFLWAGMSGVNGYVENFNDFRNRFPAEQLTVDEQNSSLIKISVLVPGINNSIYIPKDRYQFGKSYYLRVSSEGYNEGDLSFLLYATSTSTATSIIIPLSPNGITEIPAVQEDDYQAAYITVSGKIGSLTIEQLPLYPGFILGDGVDDFAVTEKELNFEDTYTVYTAFIPFQDDPARNMVLCGKDYTKDFYMNYGSLAVSFYTANLFGNANYLVNQLNVLACKRNKTTAIIKNLTTGKSTQFNASQLIDNPGLYYLWRSATVPARCRAAITGQTICNGYFSTDEEDEKILNYYKQEYPWLFPDQAWTVTGKTNEDTDRATIANITGNGNNLVLSNLGFIEGSGYNEEGEYAGYLVTDGVDDKIISSNFKFGENYTVVGEWKFLQEASDVSAGFVKNPNYRILYNYKNGINAYIKADAQGYLISGVRSIKASTSKGDIYPDFNSYVKIEPGKRIESQYALNIAVNGNIFTKLAFKNLAIYPTVLSKEDCIKAYNYLQTLKAKI